MSTNYSKQSQSNESVSSSNASSLLPSPLAVEEPAAAKYALRYFGGISTDEGAPSTAYWDDAFRRLELAGNHQADFALIEKFVFNHLLLSKAAAKRTKRRFSFAPLPLIFSSAEGITVQLKEEVIKMPMHDTQWPDLNGRFDLGER
jgi:hypothetical protein